MATDMSRLQRSLRQQGFEISRSGKGRLKAKKNGRTVVMSGASRVHARGWQNTLAELRRAGWIG